MSEAEHVKVLLVAAHGRSFALPITSLRETMRPLPIEVLPGAARGVLGVALIRGASVPVVDLAALVAADAGDTPRPAPTRFVTLKLEGGDVALAVSAVLGVTELEPQALAALPPLVDDARSHFVEALTVRDRRLLVLLNAARLLPEGVVA